MASASVMDEPLSAAAIAKRLASTNPSSRNRAVSYLISFLSSPAAASIFDDDLLKIWKGLFFCFWHADKLPAQAALAGRLAAIVSSACPSLGVRFFDTYLLTLLREWPGIDYLRLDKFYLLNRRFLRHLFVLLKNQSWDPEFTANSISILSEKVLLSADNYSSRGLGYHIAEIFLDEIRDFLPIRPTIVQLLVEPFFAVLDRSQDKVLVNKAKVNLFDRLLEVGVKLLGLLKAAEPVEPGSDAEKFGWVGLTTRYSAKFFELASAPGTLQGNRKVLFGLYDGFLKLEKDLEKSGVQIPASKLEDENFGDVSKSLVTDNGDGSDARPLRKRKKPKKALEGNEMRTVTKSKKKKKKKTPYLIPEDDIVEPNTDARIAESERDTHGDVLDNCDAICFNEAIVSNLQKQFEKVAAEAGIPNGFENLSSPHATPTNGIVGKKRKQAMSVDRRETANEADSEGNTKTKSGEKSIKKVRFSMKNNLVWKPHSPLPAHSLRLPPSTTPRGSALKKGVPPGPITEISSMLKKTKAKARSAKKSMKSSKTPSSAVKRLRMLQSFSI